MWIQGSVREDRGQEPPWEGSRTRARARPGRLGVEESPGPPPGGALLKSKRNQNGGSGCSSHSKTVKGPRHPKTSPSPRSSQQMPAPPQDPSHIVPVLQISWKCFSNKSGLFPLRKLWGSFLQSVFTENLECSRHGAAVVSKIWDA